MEVLLLLIILVNTIVTCRKWITYYAYYTCQLRFYVIWKLLVEII